jgi:hypothetical protein
MASRVNLGRINFGKGSLGVSTLKQFCGFLALDIVLLAAPDGGL